MPIKMKFKRGDKIVVISGSEKGARGEIVKSFPSLNKLLVKGINLKHKYLKPSQANPDGGITPIERPLDASKVAHIDPKTDMPTRVGYKFLENGKKVRYSKRSGEVIDNVKVGE